MADVNDIDVGAEQIVNAAVRTAQRYLGAREALWRETLDAYNSTGYVDEADHVQVKQNRLLEAVEANAARDTAALWPTRPFIPFRAKRAEYRTVAANKVKAIDGQLDRARFFESAVLWTKYAVSYGNAALEPSWDTWIERVQDRIVETDPMTGMVMKITEEVRDVMRDGLRFKVHHPWSVLWHPVGQTTRLKPWCVIKEVIPRSEVERMFDESVWDPPEGMGKKELFERLKNGPTSEHTKAWQASWQNDLGEFSGEAMRDTVVCLRMYARNRWITVLNYDIVVHDTESRWKNMDPATKPVIWMVMNPHIGPSPFWGVGEWERVRDIATLDDDIFSLVLDAQLSNNLRWYMYDPKFIDPEDLKGEHGARVEVKNSDRLAERGFDRALQILDPPEISQGLLAMHDMLVQRQNDRRGLTEPMRGVAPSPRQTGMATQMLMEAAQTRLGLNTRYVESGACVDLGYLVSKMCAANMSIVQLMDDGGLSMQEATEIVNTDPEGVPGGYQLEYEGAERVARRAEKDEKLKEFYNFGANQPVIAQGPGLVIILRKMAERTECFDEDELAEMFMQQPANEPVMPGEEDIATVGSEGAVAAPGEIATPTQNAQMQAEMMQP